MPKVNNYLEHIFYVHKGTSEYLEESLKQVKLKNPSSEIILIGDGFNIEACKGIKYEDINKYDSYAKEFAKYYIHLSDKEYGYEMFCFQRWFVILEYMRENKIKTAFYQDSDVVLDCNIAEIEYNYKFWYCDCSGHTCAFTVEILEALCEFILSYYKSKEKLIELCEIRSHMKNIDELNKWTNVTDMELISLFIYYNENKTYNIANGIAGGILGFNINAQDHTNAFYMHKYDFVGQKTKIYLIDNKLMVKDSVINKFVKVFSIHFHSDAKSYIKAFRKYNELNSSNKIYYFDFYSSEWEIENNRKEKNLIDYKISKEALINLEEYNSEYKNGYEYIKEFAGRDDINNIDAIIEDEAYENYKHFKNNFNLENKKIIGWGCGNGLNILNKYLRIDFDYLVDIDANKVGQKLNDIEICNISKILDENKNNIFIIVLSISHYYEIRYFLKVLGLEEKINFINMEFLIGYFSIKIDKVR